MPKRTSGRNVVHSTVVLLLIGLVSLLAIVGMTIWLGDRAQVYFDEVIAARDARSAAVELRNALVTAESAQRGFVITGNEIYLAPYGITKSLAERQLSAVKGLFAGFDETSVPLERLSAIIAEKFAEMDEVIALKRGRRDGEALSIIATNRGKTLSDEANIFFSGLILSADEHLTTAASEHIVNASWLRFVSIIAGIVIVIVVGGAGISVVGYTRQLAEARDEVTALNTGLEERVRERTADLAQVNAEVQRFAYIVTHDLRAPLVNIMGFTSELEASAKELRALVDQSDAVGTSTDPVVRNARTAITEDLPEAIGFIRSSTKKMDALINAILKLSREGRRSLRPERVDLNEVIATSSNAVQHQLVEANGTIELKIESPPLFQDRLSLENIFGNLLDNAVKYRSRSRALRIEVRAGQIPGDRIAIEVADNGRGIAEQDQARVFELFRRAGAQNETGEGIGLAHVRAVVRNLGGEITLRSVLDAGTTFRIILPRTLQLSETTLT